MAWALSRWQDWGTVVEERDQLILVPEADITQIILGPKSCWEAPRWLQESWGAGTPVPYFEQNLHEIPHCLQIPVLL